jgi:hypothetical protein
VTTALALPVQGQAWVDGRGQLSVPARAALQGIIRRLQELEASTGSSGTDFTAQIAQLTLDLSLLQAELDAHEADTANPHATTAAQVGADPVGTAAAAIAAHEAAENPHPQYLRDYTRIDAAGDVRIAADGSLRITR